MSNYYVFVDLETTGLDEIVGDVLEVGILVADNNFNVIANFDEVVYYPPNQIADLDDRVIDMHTKNGLWDKCAHSSNSLRGVQEHALGFLSACSIDLKLEPKSIELAGSTISFDRAWMKRHTPKLESWFHYRNIDVSSLKVLIKKYGLTDFEGEKKEAHRALDDCYDTMRELQYYVHYLGFVPSE